MPRKPKTEKPDSEIASKLFLMQTYDNGTFYLYDWTPTLAKKKGFKVIKGADAAPYLQLMKEGKNNAKYLDEARAGVVETVIKDRQLSTPSTPSVTDEVIRDTLDSPPEIIEKEEAAFRTSEEVYEMEVNHLAGLKTTAAIESHLLQKYQIELPESENPDDLREISKILLIKLRDEDKLYLIDGKV